MTLSVRVVQVQDVVMPLRLKPDTLIGAVMEIGPTPDPETPGVRRPLIYARIVSVSA